MLVHSNLAVTFGTRIVRSDKANKRLRTGLLRNWVNTSLSMMRFIIFSMVTTLFTWCHFINVFSLKNCVFLCSTQKFWPFSSVLENWNSSNLIYVLFLIENEFIVRFRVQHMVYWHFPHNTYVILKKPPSESKLLYIMTESLSRHRKVLSKVLGRERGAMRQWQLSGPSTRHRGAFRPQ